MNNFSRQHPITYRAFLFTLALIFGAIFLPSCASPGARSSPEAGRGGYYIPSETGAAASPAASGISSSTGLGTAPAKPDSNAVDLDRHGLGTGWGSRRYAPVHAVKFVRESSEPAAMATAHYNDPQGVKAMIAQLGKAARITRRIEVGSGVQWAVLSSRGKMLKTYRAGDRVLVEGAPGERYILSAKNTGDRRVEVVFSVDGLDVLDGKPASVNKHGHVIAPGQEMQIEGWRRDENNVASFEFSSVAQSYTQQKHGASRNVGIIGLAIFPEHHLHHYERQHRLKDTSDRNQAVAFPRS